MWSLYTSYHERYLRNRHERPWVYHHGDIIDDDEPEVVEKRSNEWDGGMVVEGKSFSQSHSVTKMPQPSSPSCSLESLSTPSFISTESNDSKIHHEVADLSGELWQLAKRETAENMIPPNDRPDLRCARSVYKDTVDSRLRCLPLRTHKPRGDPDNREIDSAIFDQPVDYNDPSSLRKQRHILKLQEKIMILQRWKDVWNKVRPPVPYWYELSTPQFHIEARKCLEMLCSADRQYAENHVRMLLDDLNWTQTMMLNRKK